MIAFAPIWYAVFIFSLTCHEAAHALVAKLGGDDTAYRGGQVTLNPVPHMRRSPVGTIAVPLLSFLMSNFSWMIGWASAPYDPFWQQRYPRRAAWMALAGPVANFLLVVLAAIIIKAGVAAGIFQPPESAGIANLVYAPEGGMYSAVATFLSITFSLNLLLGVFNLIPVPPLDGYTVLGLFLSEENALRLFDFANNSTFAIVGLLIAWQAIGFLFSPLFTFALNLLYPGSGYH